MRIIVEDRCIENVWYRVKYNMTLFELIQRAKASLFCSMFGGYPAMWMSEELEELLCGYIPNRHEILHEIPED